MRAAGADAGGVCAEGISRTRKRLRKKENKSSNISQQQRRREMII
jgi:hypothetical protein